MLALSVPAMAQDDNKATIDAITKVIKSKPADLEDQVKALGLSVKLGWPAQMVSSFSCTRSTAGLPNTMPPRRPLPTGRAWVQVMAGRSYHSVCPCARTPVAASADANSKDSILFMSQFV